MVGPNYRPPSVTLVPDFEGEPCLTEEVKSCQEPIMAWWKIFNDAQLEKYISMGAACNNSVKVAEANILQARALRQVTASKLYPQINADFNALRLALSKNGLLGIIGERLSPSHRIFNLFNAFIDASWEIDLFGKTRRNIEAADAHVGQMIEERNDLLVSVLGEIAINYFEVRSAQTRVKLMEENISLLERNVFIVHEQFKKGLRNGVDLQKIEAELANVRSELPDVYATMYSSMYALSILTGELPETFVCELELEKELPLPPCQVAVGLRSDLLLRRPDVRYAERQLAEATAHIGVAVASFFPKISLFGIIGFDSLKIGNLFRGSSKMWAIDGDVSMPLFQGGKLIGNLKASEAATCAAAFNYQQTVLTALADSERALVSYAEELATSALLRDAVQKNQQVVEISNQRYVRGLTTVIDLLDSERQWNAAKQNLLTSHTSSLLDLIALYKALGGGWECALAERCGGAL